MLNNDKRRRAQFFHESGLFLIKVKTAVGNDSEIPISIISLSAKNTSKIIYRAPNKHTFESLEGDRRVLSRVKSGF
ncbi:hypothetical protein NX021_10275 [Cytobacillus firmus]|nr:hypothetical protein [Cytobacillus firmus]